MDLDALIEALQAIRREHANVPEVIVEVRDVQAKVIGADYDHDVTPFVFLDVEE